jgi:hypothetical protein
LLQKAAISRQPFYTESDLRQTAIDESSLPAIKVLGSPANAAEQLIGAQGLPTDSA